MALHPTLTRFNTRATWISLLVLVILLTLFTQLNFNYDHTPQILSKQGQNALKTDTRTHSPAYTDLAKAPLKIYVPHEPASKDPLIDIWATGNHEGLTSATSKEDPMDKQACPACPSSAPAPATDSKCPDFKTMLKNIGKQECSKCPFDISRCPKSPMGSSTELPQANGAPHGTVGAPPATAMPSSSAATTLPQSQPYTDSKDRLLISYIYTESPTSLANILFFSKHALHAQADFVFTIYNTPENPQPVPHTILSLPTRHRNIRVVSKPLPAVNTTHCITPLAAHFEALNGTNSYLSGLTAKSTRFILMDSSMRGPFVPKWSEACWTDSFLSPLKKKNRKLISTGLACTKSFRPHLRTSMLGLDKETLNALRDDPRLLPAAFPSAEMKKCEKGAEEKKITEVVRDQNWEVVVLDMGFADESKFRYVECKEDAEMWSGEEKAGEVKGEVNPWETLFVDVKNETETLDVLSGRVDEGGYSSWDVCGSGMNQ